MSLEDHEKDNELYPEVRGYYSEEEGQEDESLNEFKNSVLDLDQKDLTNASEFLKKYVSEYPYSKLNYYYSKQYIFFLKGDKITYLDVVIKIDDDNYENEFFSVKTGEDEGVNLISVEPKYGNFKIIVDFNEKIEEIDETRAWSYDSDGDEIRIFVAPKSFVL